MVITDHKKNKYDAEISIIRKQMKVSITTIWIELKQKHGRRRHV